MKKHAQGELDGLCGAYAVVNAFALCMGAPPEHSDKHGEHFQAALRSLPARRFPDVIWQGTCIDDLVAMAKGVARRIRREHPIRLKIDQPFQEVSFRSLREYVQALADIQAPHASFILGVEWPEGRGGGGHWTVLRSISGNSLKFVDSDGMPRLNRQAIAIRGNRTRLNPAETVRIRLAAVDGVRVP